MPNFTSLFPIQTRFGGDGTSTQTNPNQYTGQVAAWAQGNNSPLIPTSKLEAVNIGNTFTFESNEDTRALALTAWYAVSTNAYQKGDIAVVTVDANNDGDGTSTVVLLYVGENETAASASVAADWREIGGTAMTNIAAGVGINVTGSTINNSLDIERGGTDVHTGNLGTLNFSNGFTVATDSTDMTKVNLGITQQAPIAYTVGGAIATNTTLTNTDLNSVRLITGTTAGLTITLPPASGPIPAGSWFKFVNLSGRVDVTIARNGSPIHGETTDLVLDDASANFELVYSGTTTGWVVVGAN